MADSPSKSVLPVFLFFLILLLAWFVIGTIGFRKALVSENWPTTSGRVISSRLVRPSGKSTKFEAEVIYSYKLDTTEYQSAKLKATSARGTSDWVRNIISKYPVNSEVKVHYNPKKPQDSLIEPGLQSDNFFMTLVPLVFFILVLFALFKQLKNKNQFVHPVNTSL